MKPEISVIIPCFNQGKTLLRAIESIIFQSFKSFEIIVVDDGSTDSISKIIQEIPKINYIYQENQGVTVARNVGARNASSDWLVFLDSDDELSTNALEIIHNAILKGAELKVVCGGFFKIENKTQENYIPESSEMVIPLSGTYCIKKDIFWKIGGFDESLDFSENSELFLRLKFNGIVPFLVSKELLIYYPSQSGGSKNIDGQIASIRRISEIHKDKLTRIEKFTYSQILGVLYLRKNCFKEGKTEFIKAVKLEPFQPKAWIRLLLSLFPPLSKVIYS